MLADAGDSGSWAMNESGEVYGFLIASCEETSTSYIASMQVTFEDIRSLNSGRSLNIASPPTHESG
jgi:hypothetical protein